MEEWEYCTLKVTTDRTHSVNFDISKPGKETDHYHYEENFRLSLFSSPVNSLDPENSLVFDIHMKRLREEGWEFDKKEKDERTGSLVITLKRPLKT